MLDRGCARCRVDAQAGARKQPFQPNCLCQLYKAAERGRRQQLLRSQLAVRQHEETVSDVARHQCPTMQSTDGAAHTRVELATESSQIDVENPALFVCWSIV